MIDQIFGGFLVIVGLISLYAYITKNEKMFWKKKYFTKFWGEKIGLGLHFISYVIVPIVLGVIMLTGKYSV